MGDVLAIRHVAFEDLGLLAPLLETRGHRIRYLEAGVDELALDAVQPDLLVVLGGPIGAGEDRDYPFLTAELRLLERRLAADRPLLGICLGSQLMARALGARVYPAGAKEIGWAPLTLTDAGEDSSLRHLGAAQTAVLHWHGDTFDLPPRAVRLAATGTCANQAFRYGKRALALQFHAEAAGPALERWFIGHALEIATTAGISVQTLRADTARWSPRLAECGRRCFADWLGAVGL